MTRVAVLLSVSLIVSWLALADLEPLASGSGKVLESPVIVFQDAAKAKSLKTNFCETRTRCLVGNRLVAKANSEPQTIPRNSSEESKLIKIRGVVAAYNEGIALTDGPCRQLLVVRATYWGKHKTKGRRHILVQRDYPCDTEAFPAGMFQENPHWQFTLVRDSSCDRSFEEIKDIVAMSPASGPYRIPNMKRVPGDEGSKMPTTVTFACYQLAGEVKSTGKRAP